MDKEKASIRIQKLCRGFLARRKYKKMLKVQKYVFLIKYAGEFLINLEDSREKHMFDVYIWLDLLADKIIFNFFSLSKRSYKFKGALKFEVIQRDDFSLLQDQARAFAQAILQKIVIENNVIAFGTGKLLSNRTLLNW